MYELDPAGRLRAGHASPLIAARVGRALDLAWLPLPWCGCTAASLLGFSYFAAQRRFA